VSAAYARLYSKSKCVLIVTAVEMQITPETAFVQQQHHCSCLRELQCYRHTSYLMCVCVAPAVMLSVLFELNVSFFVVIAAKPLVYFHIT